MNISKKVDFKPVLIRKHKENHLTLIRVMIHHKDTIILNIHVLNISVPNL
jgi:hypothetical protein